MSLRNWLWISASLLALAAVLVIAGCGGHGLRSKMASSALGTPGVVTTTMSDPGTCQATAGSSGIFTHIFVTVADVKMNTNANAGDSDPGFVDATPNLANAPVQVDLLGVASAQCFLAQLGSGIQIPAGNYQQLRIILANNSQTVANNQCALTAGGTSANCVQLSNAGVAGAIDALVLSSEATTGIKILSSQIAGGGITVSSGQTANLNLDFNACASVVQQPDGSFRLKPVVHAGAVVTAAAISGTVVDSATTAPIPSGVVIVALEQKDSAGVDRVIMETAVDNTGTFNLCPVPAGTYDVVISAVRGSTPSTTVQYAATVVTGVQPGSTLGSVPVIAQLSPPGTLFATITGQVTSAGTAGGVPVDVVVSALQPIKVSGSTATMLVTIPLAQQSATTQTVVTQAIACPAATDCGNYTLDVPAQKPSVAAFVSGTPVNPVADLTTPVAYTVDAQAANINSAGAVDCASGMQVGPINVTPGGTPFTASTMNFTGCQ